MTATEAYKEVHRIRAELLASFPAGKAGHDAAAHIANRLENTAWLIHVELAVATGEAKLGEPL